jgi:hypothetical protein
MKKILFIIVIFAIMLGMSNCKDPEEEGPFSLIGTWEAEGEYTSISGKQGTYKGTLTFTETEYTLIEDYIPKQGTHEHYNDRGTYVREEENIIYTDEYGNKYTYPYKFINKNSLETKPIGFPSDPPLIFKRKN